MVLRQKEVHHSFPVFQLVRPSATSFSQNGHRKTNLLWHSGVGRIRDPIESSLGNQSSFGTSEKEMQPPLFEVYDRAICIGDRFELETIRGKTVIVTEIQLVHNTRWGYKVAPKDSAKTRSSYRCFENELQRLEPMTIGSDAKPFPFLRMILNHYMSDKQPDCYRSYAEGLHYGVAQSDAGELLDEVEIIEAFTDDEIKAALCDHEHAIWEDVSPRDFIITVKTLASLPRFHFD